MPISAVLHLQSGMPWDDEHQRMLHMGNHSNRKNVALAFMSLRSTRQDLKWKWNDKRLHHLNAGLCQLAFQGCSVIPVSGMCNTSWAGFPTSGGRLQSPGICICNEGPPEWLLNFVSETSWLLVPLECTSLTWQMLVHLSTRTGPCT